MPTLQLLPRSSGIRTDATIAVARCPRGTLVRVVAVLVWVLALGGVPGREASAQPSDDAASYAVASAARIAAAGHEFAVRVMRCTSCTGDPELRVLLALHENRGRGFERESDRLWYRELHRVADLAGPSCPADVTPCEGPVRHDLVRALEQLAPGWPRAVHLSRASAARRVREALDRQAWDAAVDEAHDLLFRHGSTPENLDLVVESRQRRLRSLLDLPAGAPEARRQPTEAWIAAWGDALAIERYRGDEDDDVFDALVDAYLDAFHEGRRLPDAESFLRHVESRYLLKRSDRARALAATAHYRVAALYWHRHGTLISAPDLARLETHLEQARFYGFTGDPDRLSRRVRLVNLTPIVLPFALLGLLVGVMWRGSRVRGRLRAHRLLRRAARLRGRGRVLDAAVIAEAAWEAASRLASLERRDQLLMAQAAVTLFLDAMERREMTCAATWADRIADLPFEFWPDDFEERARRCGVDVSDRQHRAHP